MSMNDLPQIFYCNVCNRVWDAHGKIYEIKEHRNWKFVNVGNKKIGVSTLPTKVKIFDFDDFVFWYVFGGLCQSKPCPAMAYYVYLKMSFKAMSINEYKTKFDIKHGNNTKHKAW